jgi:hypothetical protein
MPNACAVLPPAARMTRYRIRPSCAPDPTRLPPGAAAAPTGFLAHASLASLPHSPRPHRANPDRESTLVVMWCRPGYVHGHAPSGAMTTEFLLAVGPRPPNTRHMTCCVVRDERCDTMIEGRDNASAQTGRNGRCLSLYLN